MSESIHIALSSDSLNIDEAYRSVIDPSHGAIDMFIGVVRNHHDGQAVEEIVYDVHQTLAEKALYDICKEALKLWPDTRYYVAHYDGVLQVNGISVIIAVSAAHREEVFKACRYVIEELKKRAPIWKKERYLDGQSTWLLGHSLAKLNST